jgi:hypothetical protein
MKKERELLIFKSEFEKKREGWVDWLFSWLLFFAVFTLKIAYLVVY